ncbi:hypothetical protein PP175_26400 (plasmid) [Aneurinibacillus sp. Ricciae_BoGa-3]|nr:hypothetical protein [Aneurinibacillus sp. Ricciae_BoGa-3]WCK57599.1 hypothetical protein PP175_26400 [Aneurinibacillus sp. Ricciae_BoGa-3]
MAKDSWIITKEQLEEWKDNVEKGDHERVYGEIEDILNQME